MTSTMEFSKAVSRLQDALNQPKDEYIRDSVIQRFEFCVELAWKTAKKVMGTSSVAPRAIVREMAQQGLISDPETWFHYLESRNLSSHTYQEALAEKVYDVAKTALKDFEKLLSQLEKL